MKNLLSVYEEIFRDTECWKYYFSMTPINPFRNNADAKEFVKKFIELSGKADDNILYDGIDSLDDKRISHIVSTLFLGTYLYRNITSIREPIDRLLEKYQEQNPDSTIKFSFLWFLICLFHDLGYNIEEIKKYDSYDDFLSQSCSVPSFLKSKVGVPDVYFNIYKAYFNYRLESKDKGFGGKPDHGICGGILLYDVLNKIVNKHIRKGYEKRTRGLYWDKKLLNIYKRVSWVILSHNIYFAWEGSKNYMDYKENPALHELILTKELGPLVKLNKHPFLFLFLLVDSIEPLKKLDYFEALDKILVECAPNILRIKFRDEVILEQFKENIEGLQWYLIPEISFDGCQITFNFEKC